MPSSSTPSSSDASWVRIRGSRVAGQLVRRDGVQAVVQTASGELHVDVNLLENAPAPPPSHEAATRVHLTGPAEDTLDLHACTVVDVEGLVAPFVDRAAVRGLMRVTIIHGKGSGRLRKAVHQSLRSHSRVARFALADTHHGSWGATVAELA